MSHLLTWDFVRSLMPWARFGGRRRLAPTWSLVDSEEETVGSADFPGQPYLVIFYLGHGCLHCAEQLAEVHATSG